MNGVKILVHTSLQNGELILTSSAIATILEDHDSFLVVKLPTENYPIALNKNYISSDFIELPDETLCSNTIIIYDQCGIESLKFYSIDGDYSKFDGVYINQAGENEELQSELNLLLANYIALDRFPVEFLSKNTKVIVCGFLP